MGNVCVCSFQVRWKVKSLFRCGRLSLTGPLCSEDRTVVQWYVFWPAPVFCYLVFDIGRKLMLWNRMQWVSSQQESKTFAISGRRQEPVLLLCRTEWRCISVAPSTSLPLSLAFILLYLFFAFLPFKCFTSCSVTSGRGYVQELLAVRSIELVYMTSWFPAIEFSFFMNKTVDRDTEFLTAYGRSHRLNCPPAKKKKHEILRTIWNGSTYCWGWQEESIKLEKRNWCWERFSGKNTLPICTSVPSYGLCDRSVYLNSLWCDVTFLKDIK